MVGRTLLLLKTADWGGLNQPFFFVGKNEPPFIVQPAICRISFPNARGFILDSESLFDYKSLFGSIKAYEPYRRQSAVLRRQSFFPGSSFTRGVRGGVRGYSYMRLESLLIRNKREIVSDWFNLLVETYPADAAQFMKRENDPFANPIGSSARSGLEAIFNELAGGMDPQPLADFLDPIIRIRAIQNFSPSQAIGFIFLLRKSVRKNLSKDISFRDLFDELPEFESRIDELALLAFDIYMECREKLYQLKEKEVKNRALLAFSHDGLTNKRPDEDPALQNK